jgi:invasion protein IalB
VFCRRSPWRSSALAPGPVLAQSAQPPDKPAEPAKIRRTETIVDDNWTVTCALTDRGGAKKQCSAILRIAQIEKDGVQRIVFSWVLGRQDGKLESVFSVPSGVLIQSGVEVKIVEKETRKLVYSLCQPDHCESVLPLDDLMVKSLSFASATEVTIYAVNGTSAKFTVNMKGFTQALADLGK